MKVFETEAIVDNLDAVLSFVNQELEDAGCPIKLQTQLDIAVEELFVNVAHYAYWPGKGGVSISISVENEVLTLIFKDSGIRFNPLERKDPDVKLSAEERQIGGLGIYLVKKTMDTIEYKFENGCNILKMTKSFR